jgi:hypothetical protein
MVCCSGGGGVVGTAVVAACAGAVTVAVTAAVAVVLPLVCSGLLHSHPRAQSRRQNQLYPQPSANFPVSCFLRRSGAVSFLLFAGSCSCSCSCSRIFQYTVFLYTGPYCVLSSHAHAYVAGLAWESHVGRLGLLLHLRLRQ